MDFDALVRSIGACDRSAVTGTIKAADQRHAGFLLDAYKEQRSIALARTDLAERRRRLRAKEAKVDTEEGLTLASDALDERARALTENPRARPFGAGHGGVFPHPVSAPMFGEGAVSGASVAQKVPGTNFRGRFRIEKVFGCIVALTATPALASSWMRLGAGSDGTQLYVDTESVVKNGNVAQAWIKMYYPKEPTRRALSSKELWKFDCSNRTSFTASQILYRGDGSVLSSDSPIETRYGYEPVVPDTFGETILKSVCR